MIGFKHQQVSSVKTEEKRSGTIKKPIAMNWAMKRMRMIKDWKKVSRADGANQSLSVSIVEVKGWFLQM